MSAKIFYVCNNINNFCTNKYQQHFQKVERRCCHQQHLQILNKSEAETNIEIIKIAMGNTLIHRSIFHLGANSSSYATGGSSGPHRDSWCGMNPDGEIYTRKVKTLPARNLTIYDDNESGNGNHHQEHVVHTLPPTKNKFKRMRNAAKRAAEERANSIPNVSSRGAPGVVGTAFGGQESGSGETSRMLFLLYLIHRTWNVLTDSNNSYKNNNKQR